MSFEAAGFRFRLDRAFSSEISLDGAEDEVQDLVQNPECSFYLCFTR
jgi:hypothetical protein